LHRVEVRDRNGNVDEAVLEIRYRRIKVLPPIGKQKRYPPLILTVIHTGKPRPPILIQIAAGFSPRLPRYTAILGSEFKSRRSDQNSQVFQSLYGAIRIRQPRRKWNRTAPKCIRRREKSRRSPGVLFLAPFRCQVGASADIAPAAPAI